ncbi:uncharacterized protein LOC104908758 [Beta vulgaris subsp. vulgaris]|uniref:uncharacterized protein LOC104908758 n=1 Tax=Beta vulgaris subsp. vulgaris TaxID=3555 RepID=UPI0020376353|nr:uncharacterized protein LOC104908758 [Beta vulgaris subsp. vulgaris]
MENPNHAVEMEKELYAASMKGNVEILRAEAQSDEYLRKKTHWKNNIIHIAIRHEQHDFIEESLRRFPVNDELFCERNCKGNTPLHVAAEVGNLSIVSLLFNYFEEVRQSHDDATEKPWRMQNTKKNTPVHVAIIHDNVKIARFLLEKDPGLAYIINASNEAPLHLAIKHHVNYSESESIMTKVKQPINEGGAALVIKFVTGEDMSSMINFLVEKGSCVTCWPDAKGSTPLHRAASLSTPYNMQVIRTILYHSPQSVEVCDASGNSILHLLISKMPNYQEGINLLKFKEIYALRNYQNQQGNTPLHIAAKNKDINMVRVLLESSTKLSIRNMEGTSAASLIQQNNLLEILRKRKMTREECEAADKANITFLRERMSRLGMDFLLSQDSEGRNVLHRLMHIKNESHIMQDDFVDFIQQVLGSSCPALVSQTDLKGDTPIHVLVRNRPDTSIYVASGNQDNAQQNNDAFVYSPLWQSGFLSVLLALCNQCILQNQEEANRKDARYDKPWLVQNAKGNTPLHEALIANNNGLAIRLLGHDQKSATLVNKSKEAPLHLLARSLPDMEPFKKEDIELMVRANVEAARMPDQDGLTPLLRAFQAGNLSTATTLCTVSSEAAKIPDAKGQTFWHLLINHPSDYYFFRLLQDVALRDLLKLKDKNGNTPLHLAIEGNRFDLVKIFFETWELERKSSSKGKWLVELLELQNKAGKTPGDLIGESSCLPPDIEKSIGDKNEMIGIRSMWGIPTVQMKTYVNTMGIIAALLTTITFTAAFTVPGGLHETSGIPIFISKVAFQVFMISDVVAMCLSMMVLFCLLWIMATSSRHNSLMILDFSVALLLASFFATLLTFMTGLFAVMFPVKPWIAIVTVVLCSLLMMLVHKFLVINLLIPLGKSTLVFLRMSWRCIARLCTNFTGCCKKNQRNRGISRLGHIGRRSFIQV